MNNYVRKSIVGRRPIALLSHAAAHVRRPRTGQSHTNKLTNLPPSIDLIEMQCDKKESLID
jgi:hypothetical protein